MKFTFRRHIPTGRYRSFEFGHTDIKLKRKIVGSISERRDGSGWRVGFIVADPKAGGGWRWVFFTKRYDSEQEARTQVNCLVYQRDLLARYNLHPIAD